MSAGNVERLEQEAERLRAENDELRRQLLQTQKMSSVGALASSITHEFNNVLTTIINYAKMGLRHKDVSTREKAFDKILSAGHRASKITTGMLSYARNQGERRELADLVAVVEDVLVLVEKDLQMHRVRLQTDFVGRPLALVNANQIQQVVLNLIVNARQAMENGGTLYLSVRPNEETAMAEISLRDTGCGIPADKLREIFEPFYTTKGNRGSGLGLSMVHGFIKQSGGYSKIYSEPGKGTTIRIYLPRALDGEVSEGDSLQHVMPTGDQEIILVVEDNAGIRDLAVRHLESLGYRTIQAADGVSALAIIKSGALIDLLFTDVVMPGGLDGRALAAEARRLLPGLKILFTSGFTAAAASAAIEDKFGSNLLSKPYRKSDLARRVRAMLDASESRDSTCTT